MTDDTNDSTTPALDLDAMTRQLTDMVVANPVPSVLAAAATGAGLMALIALMARSNSRLPSMAELAALAAEKMPSPPPVPSADSLKDQLAELLDRVTSALPSKKEAKDQAAGAAKSATDTAQSAWESVRDTVMGQTSSVRGQAANVLDQVQPQIAAATKAATQAARENPVWAAAFAGVVGTLIGAQFLGKLTGR